MRSVSAREHHFKTGEVGYFHNVTGSPVPVTIKPKPAPVINVGKLMERWHEQTKPQWVQDFAKELGVQWPALAKLGCAWASSYSAWAFPMKDGWGNFCGIRLRTNDGHKFAVRGSHQGIFVPGDQEAYDLALICEGPTDTAAALSLGFNAVGRPSCSGGVPALNATFRRHRVKSAVIIADNDDPGVRGAKMLSDHLQIPNMLLVLPCKDVREFVKLGGTSELLHSMIHDRVWRQPITTTV